MRCNVINILAIETSCDETAAAVVEDGRKVLSSVVRSQIEEHKIYGGVVPEIASRRHVEQIVPVTQKALDEAGLALADVDAVAVTAAPGLIGALLVGTSFAKGLCLVSGKPLIPVHHLRGHVASNYIAHPQLSPPFLCLVVSGGHSHIVMAETETEFRVLGKTRDDAAGEAFDKAARALGFPYPGGVYVDSAAESGDPSAVRLPAPRVEGSPLDMSFSGLKTAVVNLVHNAGQKSGLSDRQKNDVAASFRRAVCEALVSRLFLAAAETGCRSLVCAGGVAANKGLRDMLAGTAKERGCRLFLPPLWLCGDNAAMIGAQGYFEYKAGNVSGLDLNARASMDIASAFVSAN